MGLAVRASFHDGVEMPHPLSAARLRLLVLATALSACSGAAPKQQEADWYYHWNCNGDPECIATNPNGTTTGVVNEGPQEINCTQLLQFAAHFWGSSAINWCDQSATSHGAIIRLWVTPVNAVVPVGATQQYTATGTYADGTTVDLTSQVAWMAGNGVQYVGATPVATIGAGGLASARATGQIAISATYGSLTGATVLYVSAAALQSVTISPANPTVKQAATQQLVATGHYSDGSSAAISGATWTSSDTSIASIDASGLVTTGAPGTVTATASYHGVAGSTPLTVLALQSITLGPASPAVPVGKTIQLVATGHYADGSTADVSAGVAWSSASPGVATSSGYIVTGVTQGTSVVTAAFGAISAEITVTVTAPVVNAVTVTPSSATIAIGGTQQFTATAHYSDGSSAIPASGVSWSAFCVPSCATIDTAGLATGTAAATALITATFSGKIAYASLTVTAVGASWNVGAAGTSSVLTGVAWSGSQLVAVGANAVIFTSPDGLSWTPRSSSTPTTETLRAAAWSGTTWVIVGGTNGPVILTSPDGVTWTSRSSPAVLYPLQTVTYGGGQFVASSQVGMYTSPDGLTWTLHGNTYDSASAICWTGTRYVSGAYYQQTSPDGITWSYTTPVDSIAGMTWTGTQVVVVGQSKTGGGGSVSTSPDGLAWTEQNAGTTAALKAVTWTGSMLAAVGVDSSTAYGAIVTSPDGVTWTAQPPGTTKALYGIAWTGTRLVAVGEGGVVLTSP